MILTEITHTNLDFLFDTVRNNFESGDRYDSLEPKEHQLNILNKVSIYFHISDLSYLDLFYLKIYTNQNLPISVDHVNTKYEPIQIGPYDFYSAFHGIGETTTKKKFETVIHLSGSFLLSIIGTRISEFFRGFFKSKYPNTEMPFDEKGHIKFSYDTLGEYFFDSFLINYQKFLFHFIPEFDYLVDAKIFAKFYSGLNRNSTDVVLHYIENTKEILYAKPRETQRMKSTKPTEKSNQTTSIVFSVNSSIATFLLFYTHFLKPNNLLDYSNFKVGAESGLVNWIQILLSQHPNRASIYQDISRLKEDYKKSLTDSKNTLNRFSYILGASVISYTIRLSVEELYKLSSQLKDLSSVNSSVEFSELMVIFNQLEKKLNDSE